MAEPDDRCHYCQALYLLSRTYKEVELYPGSSLNLIIGPNGTGKSTFVCAIILGLCGKTNIIGRAKKISEYVRSGCSEATIEIELFQEPGQRNVIITRIFNVMGQTTWKIDQKTVKEKQVQDLIASLNIQVDNLCQLLPQDRVQDFSKMNPQELLRSTLAAVGSQESVALLDELITTRNQQKNLGNKSTNNGQMLQEQQRLNERLKVQIDAMTQRKLIENQISICQKKKLWIEYQDLRKKVVDYSVDKKKAAQLLNNHKDKISPLEVVMKNARSIIQKLEQRKLTLNREVQTIKDKIKDVLKSMKTQELNIKNAEAIFMEKLDHQKNREREIQEAKTVLEKLVVDRDRMINIVGDENKVKMELATLHKPILKTNAAIETLKKQKLEIQYDLENNVMPQIRLYQNRIRNLKDVNSKRLEVLRSASEDAYAAVQWLRENRHLFQCPVYEPMVLEINFTEGKYACYLESTVANRDLVAFTFESSQDMNLFLKKVRVEKGLKQVNAICSPPSNAVFRAPCEIEDLSYLGFYTYLVDTISAPEAITRYLCKQYSIHRIPIGNDHTYNNSGKVPSNISFFFTSKHRFTVRVSAYSGAKSSSTVEIRPAKLLANTVDVEQLNICNNQLSKFEQNGQEHRQKLQMFDGKLATLEEGLNELYTRRKNINESVEKVKAICAQIRVQMKKVQDIEKESIFNLQEEKAKCKRLQKDAVLKQCKLQSELCTFMKDIHSKIYHGELWM
ncbi:Structural maintenance of chromosomes protein 5, partial [Eumeta japonica]